MSDNNDIGEDTLREMYRAQGSKKQFAKDLEEVFIKHGITDFCLMAFKAVETSHKKAMVGFNVVALSERVIPAHVSKKVLVSL